MAPALLNEPGLIFAEAWTVDSYSLYRTIEPFGLGGSPGGSPGGAPGTKTIKSAKMSSQKSLQKNALGKMLQVYMEPPPPTLKIGVPCTRNHCFH